MAPRVRLPSMAKPVSPLLLASIACWGALVLFESVQLTPLCAASPTLMDAGVAFATLNGKGAAATVAALVWMLMIGAMTAPLLAQPIAQLRLRSFAQRRDRSTILFVASYVLVWFLLGPILLAIPNLLSPVARSTSLPVIMIAAVVAATWQAAPLRQILLNRCHRVPNLAAFGAEADRDCIRFGLIQGALCAATCAPAMLLPFASPQLHLPVMFVLSVAFQIERLAPPRTPAWTLRILPGQSAAFVLFRSIRGSLR